MKKVRIGFLTELNYITFHFYLEVVDVIYNWVSVDDEKRKGERLIR